MFSEILHHPDIPIIRSAFDGKVAAIWRWHTGGVVSTSIYSNSVKVAVQAHIQQLRSFRINDGNEHRLSIGHPFNRARTTPFRNFDFLQYRAFDPQNLQRRSRDRFPGTDDWYLAALYDES